MEIKNGVELNSESLLKQLMEANEKIAELEKLNKYLSDNFNNAIGDNEKLSKSNSQLREQYEIKNRENKRLVEENNKLFNESESKTNDLLEINDKFADIEDKILEIENVNKMYVDKINNLERDNHKLYNYINFISVEDDSVQEFIRGDYDELLEELVVVRNDGFFKDYPELMNYDIEDFTKYVKDKGIFPSITFDEQKITYSIKKGNQKAEIFYVLNEDNESIILPDFDPEHPNLSYKTATTLVELLKNQQTLSMKRFVDMFEEPYMMDEEEAQFEGVNMNKDYEKYRAQKLMEGVIPESKEEDIKKIYNPDSKSNYDFGF